MAENADAVFVGMTGSLFVAPAGTAAPATLVTAPATPWVMLGFVSEDGVSIQPGITTEDIGVWQSPYPVRRLVTERTFEATFALRQWDAATIPFAFGGGAVAGTTDFTYDGPDPEELDFRALLIEVLDGTKTTRLYLSRGVVSELAESQFVRNAAADLGVTFAALEPTAGGPVFSFLSNDPAWDPASVMTASARSKSKSAA